MKIIKCHYYHIISRITLCSLFIILLLLIMDKIIVVLGLDYNSSSVELSLYYFQNVFETDKIFSILITSFIFGYSMTNEQDSYRSFVLVSNVTRKKYFLLKVLTISIIIFIYICLVFISFFTVGRIKGIIIRDIQIVSYLSLFLMSCYYGLLSCLFIQLFNNFYLVILPFVIYIICNSLIYEDIFKFLQYLIVIINEKGLIPNGMFVASLFVILILFLNLFVFMKRDFIAR